MVFNSLLILSVAHASAEVWQRVACLPEDISSDQLLDLIFCLPLQRLGRFALCLWTFLCFPPPDSHYSYPYYDTDSSSSDFDNDDDDRHYYIESHSD